MKMRNKAALSAAFSLALALLAVFAAAQAGSEALTKLGLTAASAKTDVLETLATGSAYNDAAFKAFKALTPAARASIVKSGLAWIKAYVATPEFAAAYAKLREGEKPQPPDAVPSAEEQIKKQKDDFEKQVAEMRKGMAGLDAATRKSMEDTIKQMQAQYEKMEKDPQQKETFRQMVEAQREENKTQYAEQLKVWEEQYPSDLRRLIQNRIREFLEISADVDYAAKLIPRGKLQRFAEANYEEKPAAWKICFRAGKEATEAARVFAQAWLAELEK
jgi:transketolase